MIFSDEFINQISKKIKTITSVQFGIILILFFMPFVSVSCSGAMNVELTGIDMAFGTTVPEKDPFTGRITDKKINAEILISLVFLVTVIGFIVSLTRIYLRSRLMVMGLSGVLGGVLLLSEMVKVNHQIVSQGGGMVQVSWAWAYWIILMLFLMITVSVFLTWFSFDKNAGKGFLISNQHIRKK